MGRSASTNSIVPAQSLKTFKPTDVSFPIVNLSYAYWMTGRYEESVEVFLKGLRDRESEFGVNDRVSFM